MLPKRCCAQEFYGSSVWIAQATLVVAKLFENAFPENSNLRNSTYNNMSFLLLIKFDAQIFIPRNENTS